jgi:hypothetical protein
MGINSELQEIIGKKITHVITTENGIPPIQLFLVFEDGTSMEFYGRDLQNAKNMRPWDFDQTLKYAQGSGGSVTIYIDDEDTDEDIEIDDEDTYETESQITIRDVLKYLKGSGGSSATDTKVPDRYPSQDQTTIMDVIMLANEIRLARYSAAGIPQDTSTLTGLADGVDVVLTLMEGFVATVRTMPPDLAFNAVEYFRLIADIESSRDQKIAICYLAFADAVEQLCLESQ